MFLTVFQRISKGRDLDMSLRSFNRRVKLFNKTLATRVKQIRGVYFFRQAINHPLFICGDGCHLTDEGPDTVVASDSMAVTLYYELDSMLCIHTSTLTELR